LDEKYAQINKQTLLQLQSESANHRDNNKIDRKLAKQLLHERNTSFENIEPQKLEWNFGQIVMIFDWNCYMIDTLKLEEYNMLAALTQSDILMIHYFSLYIHSFPEHPLHKYRKQYETPIDILFEYLSEYTTQDDIYEQNIYFQKQLVAFDTILKHHGIKLITTDGPFDYIVACDDIKIEALLESRKLYHYDVKLDIPNILWYYSKWHELLYSKYQIFEDDCCQFISEYHVPKDANKLILNKNSPATRYHGTRLNMLFIFMLLCGIDNVRQDLYINLILGTMTVGVDNRRHSQRFSKFEDYIIEQLSVNFSNIGNNISLKYIPKPPIDYLRVVRCFSDKMINFFITKIHSYLAIEKQSGYTTYPFLQIDNWDQTIQRVLLIYNSTKNKTSS
jgi:hypothetical protein